MLAIARNERLQSVDLSRNKFTDSDVQTLLAALAKKSHRSHLYYLNLKDNRFLTEMSKNPYSIGDVLSVANNGYNIL